MSDFILAAKSGDLSKVKKLVTMGCDVNMTDGEDQYNALYWAACYGHAQVVGFLVNNGANINQPVKWGSTALHAAAERGHRDCIFYLTKGGCDMNARNWNLLDTPLHLAAYRGHLQVCQDLVRGGADVTLRNKQGKTALDEASSQGKHKVYDLLLQQLQDPTVKYNSSLRGSNNYNGQWHYNISQDCSVDNNSLETDGATSVSSDHQYPPCTNNLSPGAATLSGTVHKTSTDTYCHTDSQHATHKRPIPGKPNSLQKSGVVNEGKMNIAGQQGSEINHKEVQVNYNNSKKHLLANGHQAKCEDDVDGFLDPRIKFPSEHFNPTLVLPQEHYVQGNTAQLWDQSSSYFKPNYVTHDNISAKDSSLFNHSHPLYHNTVHSNVPGNQSQVVYQGDASSRHTESHKDLLSILQLQIVNVRDEVEFLKHKNTELWIQCEKYRNNEAEKSKLLILYNQKYKQCLAENQQLKKKLKENETKTKAAIVKLMQHYKKSPTQSSSPSAEGSLELKVDRSPPQSTFVDSLGSSEDLIQLDISHTNSASASSSKRFTAETSPSSDGLHHQSNNLIDFTDSRRFAECDQPKQYSNIGPNSCHLREMSEKIPQQCSDGSEPHHQHVDTRRVMQHSESPNSSTSSQSSDSFTSRMVQSYTANCTDHKDLFSAILPVFQAMDPALQASMSTSLQKQLQKRSNCSVPGDSQVESSAGREWVCGRDYVLLNDLPINKLTHFEGSSSLVFRIQHNAKAYILKMLVRLLDVSRTPSPHCPGQISMPPVFYHQFSTDHDIPSSLPHHPNVARIVHHYQGDTAQFRRFLPKVLPSQFEDAAMEMTKQTTFLVMPVYPTTLVKMFEETVVDTEEATNAVPEVFVLQKIYDVLSAVHHLQQHKVVHRDIKADNVFLDQELRAVLGDFGFARRFQECSGESIPFVDRSQVVAGNRSAWTPELESVNRGGPESLSSQISLEEIYSTTDSYAVGKMFFNLLCQKSTNQLRCALTDIRDSYSVGLRYVIKRLCHSDSEQRLKTSEALVLIGLLLFGPEQGEIQSKTDCIIWHQSRMMKLLVQKNSANSRDPISGDYICTIEESIVINNGLTEKSFFSVFSGEQMWECFSLYQSLKS